MAADIRMNVRGIDDFRKAAARIRDANRRGELISNIRSELQREAKPAVVAARSNAFKVLPRSGGLAALVAQSNFGVSTRTSGRWAGVFITAKRKGTDLVAVDRGRVRHPVYGNRKVWVTQQVVPNWFTGPMRDHADEMQDAVWRAIDDLIEDISG